MSQATALSVALRKPFIPFVPAGEHKEYKKNTLETMANVGKASRPNNIKKNRFDCSSLDDRFVA
jgi:hypothetical protein